MGTVTFNFSGEVALITGGSRGLGLEIAQAFGGAGAMVVITARRQHWLSEAEQLLKDQGIAVHALTCNVADSSSVEQTVQQALSACGKIDILVNNAGLTWGAPAENMPLDRWHQVIEANLTGTFLMSQVVGRHMLERQKGAWTQTSQWRLPPPEGGPQQGWAMSSASLFPPPTNRRIALRSLGRLALSRSALNRNS